MFLCDLSVGRPKGCAAERRLAVPARPAERTLSPLRRTHQRSRSDVTASYSKGHQRTGSTGAPLCWHSTAGGVTGSRHVGLSVLWSVYSSASGELLSCS